MTQDYSALLESLIGFDPTLKEAEAASAIRALVAENDGLRRALTEIASCEVHHPSDVVSIARAALEETK